MMTTNNVILENLGASIHVMFRPRRCVRIGTFLLLVMTFVYDYSNLRTPPLVSRSSKTKDETILMNETLSSLLDDDGNTNLNNTEPIVVKELTKEPAKKEEEKEKAEEEEKLSTKPLPYLPLQALENYKKWHSQESMLANPNNRKFLIGYYSCPKQAGNRLHQAFNSLLWAIMTNRTLLLKHWDKTDCFKTYLAREKEPKCHSGNTQEDCEKALRVADWIPTYSEWSSKLSLNITADNPIPRTIQIIHGIPAGIMPNAGNNATLMDFFAHVEPSEAFANDQDWHDFFGMNRTMARETSRVLLSRGMDFLYGMCFRNMFEFQQPMMPPVHLVPINNNNKYDDNNTRITTTIALHSRHVDKAEDGSNVTQEIQCLDAILEKKKQQQPSSQCIVFLMSDRSLTLEHLTRYVTDKNCSAVIAPHENATGIKDEHGPFASYGFIQDLALASNARHGFIGHRRSSSSLVREIMSFDHAMEVFHARGNNEHQQLSTSGGFWECELPYDNQVPSWEWKANLKWQTV